MPTPDEKNKAAADMIEMLDLWEMRNKDAVRFSREHQRQPFRQTCWISPADGDYRSLQLPSGKSLKAWSRDLTPGGMGFITTRNIEPDEIIICMTADGGGGVCIKAAVKRRRKVHQDFWEFGVQFQEKVENDEIPTGVKESVSV